MFLKKAEYLSRFGVPAIFFLGKQSPAVNHEVEDALRAGNQGKLFYYVMVV